MSEFLRAKQLAKARDVERSRELERLKQHAAEQKVNAEREHRLREQREREDEIAHLKQQRERELEAQRIKIAKVEIKPRSMKMEDPKGPGSLALSKIRNDLKMSSTSPSGSPSRTVSRAPSSQPSQRSASYPGPNTTPRSTSRPRKSSASHKAPTRNAPPKITTSGSSQTARGKMSLEMAGQPILHALNQNKRDLRSIDEIERDIKAKRLALGRESDRVVVEKPKVNGFFGEVVVVGNEAGSGGSKVVTAPHGGVSGSAVKPANGGTSAATTRESNGSTKSTTNDITKPKATQSQSRSPAPKNPTKPIPSSSSSSNTKVRPPPPATSTSKPSPPRRKILPPPKSKVTPSSTKRREREPSTSDSDSSDDSEREYARKRRALDRRPPVPPSSKLNASEEIWKLFGRGKTKQDYLARDLSDSGSDMEVSAEQLAREEARTARIAREEDARAEAEERRHAEAKRRRLGKK